MPSDHRQPDRRVNVGTFRSTITASPISSRAAGGAAQVSKLAEQSIERMEIAYDMCVAARDAINGIYSQPRVIGPADAAEKFVFAELDRAAIMIDQIFKIARAATPLDLEERSARLRIMMHYASCVDDPEICLQIAAELAETYAGAVS